MHRFLSVVAFGAALLLVNCGRQVTGLGVNSGASIQPGHMLIRYRVAGQLDFTHVTYLVVFNTSGNAAEPYPAIALSGAQSYSFAFAVGGSNYASLPLLYQYYLAPGTSGLQSIGITIPPQLINYVPNAIGNPNGGGEFDINFDRQLLYGVNPAGSPSPLAAASISPQPNPSSMPSSVPSLSPIVQPTTIPQHVWAINFITVDSVTRVPIDSMGIGGPTDTTFRYTVDTTTSVDDVFTKPTGTGTIQNASAQLQGYEVINAP